MTEDKGIYATKTKTIFRTIKNEDHPFVMIDRRPVENPALSWGAKGVLSYLLSRPDNWTVRLGDLIKRSTDGTSKIRGYIRELVNTGHVHRVARKDPQTHKIIEWTLEVYELPFTSEKATPPVSIGVASHQVGNRALNDNESVNDIKNGVPPISTSKADMPLDWKILHGEPITEEDLKRQEDSQRKDSANLIATGLGVNTIAAYELAYAFQDARNITIPTSKISGQRKAVKEMLEMKVRPSHIREAVEKLTADGMTIVDLFSVSGTAQALANPAPAKVDNRPHPEYQKVVAPAGVTYAPPPPKIKLPK